MRRSLVFLMVLVVPLEVLGQSFSFGSMPANPTFTRTISIVPPTTMINVGYQAKTSGTVSRVSVQRTATCAGAFKVVFLQSIGGFPNSFYVLAERGPFDAVAGRNDITLTPPVNVGPTTVLGIVELQSYATCGSVGVERSPQGTGGLLITAADVSVGGTLGLTSILSTSDIMGAIAYDADPLLVSVLPAAGAVQGAGAFFRTSVQLRNQTTSPISGKLVFHPAGQSGSAGDPSLSFTLNTGQVVTFNDVVTSMGASGLGSIDVLTNGGAMPIVSARVYSDGGSAGTSGFTEDAQPLGEALAPSDRVYGVVFIPSDPINFRTNVGVRTLGRGATIDFRIYNEAGNPVTSSAHVSYPPNYFEQRPAAQLMGLAELPAGGSIVAQLVDGSAFVYASVTDNRTSDSAMRMAKTP